MGDSDGKQKPLGIPSWQKSTEPSKGAEEASSTPDSREEVVAQARRFLDDDEVKDASREKKIAFLESKGLQKEEIETLLGGNSTTSEAPPSSAETTTSVAKTSSPQSQAAAEQPPSSERARDVPPIITYPEFLTAPTAPAPLVTRDRLLTALYLFGGLSTVLYGTNNYLLTPMLASLTEARLSLAETASANLEKLISKLEEVVSVIPAEVTIGNIHKAESDEGREGSNSEEEDPTELFHRDFGVQTSLPPTPTRRYSITSEDERDALETQTSRISNLTRNLRSFLDFDKAEEEGAGELNTSVTMVQEYLDSMVGAARRYDFIGASYGVSSSGRGAGEQDDEISKVKTQIIGVKGVLLSARNFPRGGAKPGAR